MKSAGNDIVALGSVNKERTVQFNFYSKMISPGEQEVYKQSSLSGITFDSYVWLLWSVKESVYKYLKRILPDLVFSPTKIAVLKIEMLRELASDNFECNDQEHSASGCRYYAGYVEHGSHILHFRSRISGKWIASIVNENRDFSNVWWGVQSTEETGYDNQSASVRKFVLQKLTSFFSGDLTIRKSALGCPIVMKKSEALDLSISLAHHGGFVSYAFSDARE